MRKLAFMCCAAAVLLAGWGGSVAAQDSDAGVALVVEVTGILDPVLAELIEDSVAEAQQQGARLLVFRLDSGQVAISDNRLNELAEVISSSDVNIAVWVGPNGAAATGKPAQLAGVADAVGIAPGVRLGDLGPQVLDAERFGTVWGEAAPLIRDRALGWRELIAEDVVACDRLDMDDLADRFAQLNLPFDPETNPVPPDEEQCSAPLIGDFLVDLDELGFESRLVADNEQPRLEPLTQVQFRSLSLAHQLFHTVASPPVAYLLFAIGLVLLLFEFYTAGIGVAGTVGAVLLVLGGYGLWVLPVNLWAVALLVVSMAAFAVDVQTNVPRFWTGVGLIMFAAGTWWLYDGVSMSWIPMLVGVGSMAIAMISGMPSMVRTRFSTPTIGRGWMIGEVGDVVEDVSPDGVINLQGALWRARTNRATPVPAGDRARVVEIQGLWLEVEPLEGAARDYRQPKH